MYDLDYVDETIIEECKKSFKRVYPEFRPYFLGVNKDKTCLIATVDFPDGTFFFRVSEKSVSAAYNSVEDADKY